MNYFIGIDIGTGSTKAVAVNISGEPIHSTQCSYPTYSPELTYSEQDPELIWKAFVQCILDLIANLKEKPLGVVLSSAMHSVIPVDEKGNQLMNMITWADNRSADVAKALHGSTLGEKIYSETGTPIHAMTPVCKIKWLAEKQPDLFTKTFKFISIKEFVWFKLFGVYEVDYSIASATGMFDIGKLAWNESALKYCGVTPSQLSMAVETHHSRKDLVSNDFEDLKSENIPFFIGASDGCMANLGSFAVTPGVAALTIGTSGAIRVANRKPTVNFRAMTFNYILTKDIIISGGPINNGGVVLKWYIEIFLKKQLNSPGEFDAFLDEMKSIRPGADGLIFIPYLLGERAPIWDSDASGIFFGIRNFHTQAHFTRAVAEGISMALYSIAASMETTGLSIDRVHVSGGFVQSEEWLQILADIFNKEICLINAEDASAVGAAYLGFKSLGLIQDYSALKPKQDASYTPNLENHAVYQKAFAIFENLYKKMKPEMDMLLALRE
ncbi:MAG TPA: gluconokinase [Chryseolinea sp.]